MSGDNNSYQERVSTGLLTAIIVLSVFGMGVAAFTTGAVAQSQTIVVDAEGTGNYTSIQNAIDNASQDDVIEVKAGTYNESVTIDVEGLTLEGPNVGLAGDSDQRGDEATITDANNRLVIEASNVTINGLNFEFDGQAIQSKSGEDNLITNSRFELTGSTSDQYAVRVGGGSPGTDVINNLFTDIVSSDGPNGDNINGVVVTDPRDTRVANNVFSSVDTAVNAGDKSPEAGTLIVENNEFSDITQFGAVALVNSDAGLDADINNNTIESSRIGIGVFAGDSSATFSIQDNDFQNFANDEVFVDDQAGVLTLDDVLNAQGNTFDPDGEVVGDQIRVEGTAPADAVVNLDSGQTFTGGSAVQDAVDAASQGNTIRVGPGTFDESVNIPTNDITLEGAGVDSSTISGQVNIGQGTNSVSTTGVTVRGFTLAPDSGFAIETTIEQDSNVTIEDNRIEGAAGAAAAAFFQNPDGIEIRNNEFVGPNPGSPTFSNTVGDLLVVGSGADDDGDDYVIADNTFEGIVNRDQQPSGGNAIEIRTDGAVIINNNEFTAASSENGALIFVSGKSTNLIINNNEGGSIGASNSGTVDSDNTTTISTNPNAGISEINITLDSDTAQSVDINARVSSNNEDLPADQVATVVDITPRDSNGNVVSEPATIEFTIPQQRLTALGVTASELASPGAAEEAVIFREVDSGFEQLELTSSNVAADGGNAVVTIETSGFSEFVVGVETGFGISTVEVASLTAPEEVTDNELFEVGYTVENVGEEPTRKGVELIIDGEEVANKPDTLTAGQSVSNSFTNVSLPSDVEPGDTVEVTVRTGDDAETQNLTVADTDGSTGPPSVAEYANDQGIVDIDGVSDAISDWQNGEIGIGLVSDIISAWQSGNPVE